MRTEYDDPRPPPQPEKKKVPKRDRRAAANKKARQVLCPQCGHSVPDHTNLAGAEKTHHWCEVCHEKCRKEKIHAQRERPVVEEDAGTHH